jgi:HSP20 family protein
MDTLVRRFFDRSTLSLPSFWETPAYSWVPAIDVFHRGDDLVVRAELPGIDPEKDLEISLHDNVLRIRGERRMEERTEGDGTYRLESRYGSFWSIAFLRRESTIASLARIADGRRRNRDRGRTEDHRISEDR